MEAPLKRLARLTGVVILVLGCAGQASASQIWATNVSTLSGWVDADKTWVGDTNLCWAAAASNVLAWGGWTGGPGLITEDQILADFNAHWTDDPGNPYYGIEWWFTGTNGPAGEEGWAQLDGASRAGFYTQTLFDDNNAWNPVVAGTDTLTNIGSFLGNQRGTMIRIGTDAGDGHFLTVWGVDADAGVRGIWVTDSDSGAGTLDYYTVGAGDHLSGGYSTWNITEIDGLIRNSGRVQPTLPSSGVTPTPVSEPSTLILIGSGLCAVVSRRRKK